MKTYVHPRCFSLVITLMACLTLSAPFVAFAQQVDAAEARMAAENDAQTDTNGGLWLIGGCFFGLLAVGAASIIEPSAPSARLIGKSPEYVMFYTDAYKAKAKSIQTSKSLTGCIVGTIVTTVLYVALVAAVVAEDGF